MGLLRVTVYYSDYGIKKIREQRKEHKYKYDSILNNHLSEPRMFERSKLRWFYAIAEFDSEATANLIYSKCNGVELQKFSTNLDLRFVHNCADFTNKKIRDTTEGPQLKHSPQISYPKIPLKLKSKPTIDNKTDSLINVIKNMTKDSVYKSSTNASNYKNKNSKTVEKNVNHNININDPRFTEILTIPEFSLMQTEARLKPKKKNLEPFCKPTFYNDTKIDFQTKKYYNYDWFAIRNNLNTLSNL